MTFTEVKPTAAALPQATDSTKTAAPTPAGRMVGGREYELAFNTTAFNSTEPPAQVISAAFARVLENAKILSPRFEIKNAADRSGLDSSAIGTTEGSKLILTTDLEPDTAKTMLTTLKENLANNPDLLFERITRFDPSVAGKTRTLALIATIASWIIIIAYLWWRFHSFTYGVAAVLAVVHDVLITLGAIAVSYWLASVPYLSSILQIDQFKIDLPIVAAFLTLIGFSVNDTIVIFDRIRESRVRRQS